MIQSTLNLLRESIASQSIDILAGVLKLIQATMIHTFTEDQFQELVSLKDSIPTDYKALYIELLVEYPFFSIDKAWYYVENSQTLIQEKNLDSNEVEILKELGKEFEKNHSLHPVKASELYNSFFKKASPIDVMLTLNE